MHITHEDLLDMWEKDAEIDKFILDDESLKIPSLHHKYLKYYLSARSKKIALEHKLEDLRREKELYYSGQASSDVYKEKPFDVKLKTRSGVDKHVNTDPEVVRVLQKIEYYEVLIDGLSHILNQIQWRNQHIKNAIDYIKFQNGGI